MVDRINTLKSFFSVSSECSNLCKTAEKNQGAEKREMRASVIEFIILLDNMRLGRIKELCVIFPHSRILDGKVVNMGEMITVKVILNKHTHRLCPAGARGGRSLVGRGQAGEEGGGGGGQKCRERSEPSQAAEEREQREGDGGQRRAVKGRTNPDRLNLQSQTHFPGSA